jgi:hypothetical protein
MVADEDVCGAALDPVAMTDLVWDEIKYTVNA